MFEEIEEQPLYGQICKHAWLMENVTPHLPLKMGSNGKPRHRAPKADGDPYFDLDRESLLVLPRHVIRKQVREFVLGPGEPVELWGYYSAYDHVLLSQLYGRMIDHPAGLPMWTNDVQQLAHQLGLEESLPSPSSAIHNALADARWTRDAYNTLIARHNHG